MSGFSNKTLDRDGLAAQARAADPSEVEDGGGMSARALRDRLAKRPVLRPLLGFATSLLRLNRTRAHVIDHAARLEAQRHRMDELAKQLARAEHHIDRLAGDLERERRDTARSGRTFDARLAALSGNLDLLSRNGPAGKTERATGNADAGSALLDDFYVALEQRFRGSLEDIAKRQQVHLAELQAMQAEGQLSGPVLDLGCGRGEWLALLQEAGIEAVGVDTNEGQLAEARQRGLAVTRADGLAFLQAEPEARFGAVTAFHLVEHLPFAVLAEWLAAACRVLKPGGLLLIETPNPENLIVGAHTFHMDPTHQKPVPSGLLNVLCETIGFETAEIRPLHPHARLKEALKELPGEIAYLLYGYQDYALLTHKPAGRG